MSRFAILVALALSLFNNNADAVPAALMSRKGCTIATYTDVSNVSGCPSISILAQTVPAGKSLALSGLKDGTIVHLSGDIDFEAGIPIKFLFSIIGGNISFNGNNHTIHGNGGKYWDTQGTNGGQPKPIDVVYLQHSGTFTNVIIKDAPSHAFAIQNPSNLTISNVIIDNAAGAKLGHNTDGFDVAGSTNLTIENCRVNSQDDCLAINSATNLVFRNNICMYTHGISIAPSPTGGTVNGVTISNNHVIKPQQGLRIKTTAGGVDASVSNVIYKDNTVTDATDYAVVIVQDYTNDHGETGTPTPGIPITNISFLGTNNVSIAPGAIGVAKVLCATTPTRKFCNGVWDWSGLKTTDKKKGTNVGGAPITGYTF